jgi:hypothetical protein
MFLLLGNREYNSPILGVTNQKKIWHKLGELHQKATGKCMLMNKEKCLLGIGAWIATSGKQARLQRNLCLLTRHYIHLCK